MDMGKFPSIEYFNINPKGHRMENHVKNNFPEFYSYINSQYPKELSWMEKLFWYYNNITETPKCIECGTPVKFRNFDKGYFQYCCQKCSNKSMFRIQKINNTIKDKYGVDNISKLDDIKKKKEETIKKHYGVNHWLQLQENQMQIQNTMLKKYGVRFAHQLPEIKEKTKQTNIERYGGVGVQSPEIKEKTKQTNIERYGVENPYQIPSIIEKRKRKSIEKYGAENPFNSDEFKDWLKQYNIEKYGCKYSISSNDVRNKIKQVMVKKYGVENPSNIDGINHKRFLTRKINNTFNTSKIESDFDKWLIENNIPHKWHYRAKNYPFECDFYFPDKDIFLEIQGHWGHGGHPFDPNNKNDLKILNEWISKNTKYYNNAIEVWTVRDPMKRQWIKDHGLNWHEIFTTKLCDLINWYNSL